MQRASGMYGAKRRSQLVAQAAPTHRAQVNTTRVHSVHCEPVILQEASVVNLWSLVIFGLGQMVKTEEHIVGNVPWQVL